MDEPFRAVDPVVREQLQEEFLRIQKELSKTIIMVTHDIDEAMKLDDRVAVLKPGCHDHGAGSGSGCAGYCHCPVEYRFSGAL